ncbi:MAG TPA: hexose kinase [Candidatus Limnocylindrales bacterium]|nr:hexose kinase [Candidatus Limnocylindrales bacterium]
MGRTVSGRLLFVAANPSIDRLYELDRLVAGEIHRPLSVVAVPGGKGLNATRAAAALGGSVTAVGIVAGRAGDWIVERLALIGIDARMARSSGETRTCVSVLDRSTGAMTEIYEHGEAIDAAAWDALEAIIRAEVERGDLAAVALSGSLPPGAPPEGFARIARSAASGSSAGPIPVIADTYGPALTAVLAERPAMVKLNAAEAGEASGMPVTDPASAAVAAGVLLDAGAGDVVVTLGVAGAVVVGAGERAWLRPPDIRGAYPVGSGDAFLGGLAVARARGEPIVMAARFGMAAGIANAQLPGAGGLDPNAVESILGQITLSSRFEPGT